MKKNKNTGLNDYEVLTFDCYGTLIDWETGIWDAFQPLIMSNGYIGLTRERALEAFAVFESRMEVETPDRIYPEILSSVHAAVAGEFGLRTTGKLDAAFGDSIAHWPAFPDTADALRYLKTQFRLVVVSNVSRAGFAASQRKLGVEFDAVYTAQDIGSYKPDPANFRYLLDRLGEDLGLGKKQVLHTAQSLFHDHLPAASLGLATAWIDRQRLSETGSWGATHKLDEVPVTDFLFHSMAEMAAAVAAGLRK
ncbi:MAG: HAD hydrolase-like protein [Xanthomonadales bacterium]|nr:HAD hydrolase-like protein [Gammaproteobacteria bacterium]MBT8052354.1 HAD hydrolase-like protein [Gammaproteobacteria bacterium]NND56536.1 HAD hydrolase-like protein [Xanthomonadales bacterium]NNK52565.1 HAD hydrolase-like protein [Xanthomonadales bacterium]